MSLDEARRDIDRVDAEIVRLLDERARIGRRIGALKRKDGLPLHQPGREADVLAKRLACSDGSFPTDGLSAIYRVIMAETLTLQYEEDEPVCPGHTSGDGKRDAEAVVVENSEAAPGFFRMRIRSRELAGAFRPGQFFQITAGEADATSPFLRRPFAPGEYLPDGFAFYYAVIGDGTRRLAAMTPGTAVRILAPLGNAFTIQEKGTALLVGGGCGVPSLAPLADELNRRGVRVVSIAGAKTAAAVLGRRLLEDADKQLIIATDDGTDGCRGTVVDAYRQRLTDIGQVDAIYALGPLPMLRAVSALARESGIACEVSLEERMACGFGACMGCAVLVHDGKGGTAYRRVCHDGPVFDATTIAWNG